MSVRRLIAEADVSTLNVSRFCRDHGIGRDAFYAVRRRFEARFSATRMAKAYVEIYRSLATRCLAADADHGIRGTRLVPRETVEPAQLPRRQSVAR